MTTSPLSPGEAAVADPDDVRGLQLRLLLAVLLLGSGAAHLPVMEEHLREAAWMGSLFAAFAVATAALAAAVALSGRREPVAWAGALCVLALLAYAATRLFAFPQLSDDVGDWAEPWGIVSVVLEVYAAALAFLIGYRARERDRLRSG
ncbi:hypothetical protein V2S66_24570 [Streptomyces sp. V4-01]|uniref:Uncharacterized protein n=1 Tax=Actinacidiphila polyblastidii TaxID=3110430 RepID=A0ABU7PH33_9ACTN|nr:hypothetical protein [Streptomyces sp. V4-01]